MAKIIITGTAASLKSAVKMADLKKLENAFPKALIAYDNEKNEVFRIATATKGSIGKFGVSFDKRDRAGYAMVTITGEDFEGMSKDALAEKFMPVLLPLNDMEDHIATHVLPGFKASVAEAAASIEIAGEVVIAEEAAPEVPAEAPTEE